MITCHIKIQIKSTFNLHKRPSSVCLHILSARLNFLNANRNQYKQNLKLYNSILLFCRGSQAGDFSTFA